MGILPNPSVLFLLATAVVCVLFQRLLRARLKKDQYFYMRDLSLAGALVLLGLWSGRPTIALLVAASLLSLYIGLADQVKPWKLWSWCVPLPGLFFALWGARISFFSLTGSSYYYLNSFKSVALTTCWMSLFPLLFKKLDQIPGLAGHLLSVSLCLMSFVTALSSQDLSDAFLVCLGSLLLVAAYWSRLGHHYRQLDSALCFMWGTLVAGISILGVSKGIAITSLIVIPLGFYALPLVEFSLGVMNKAFTSRRTSTVPYLYGKMLERGVDHPSAVRLVTTICFLLGGTVTFFQVVPHGAAMRIFVVAITAALGALVWTLWGGRQRKVRRELWGVRLDGISMNYALSKALAWLKHPQGACLVVTLNALGINETRSDPDFRRIANGAELVLPDGSGLVMVMRMLQMAVVERIAGIDFAARLCRLAAVEKFPVFLYGGLPGRAQEAAQNLQKLNPGLIIAGTQDGYHDKSEDSRIAKEIAQSGARILFVGLGQPKQEKWIHAHRADLQGILSVGVGGSLDVFAERLKRAPAIYQKLGLEWLYRLIQEPGRFKKDIELASFVFWAFVEKIGLPVPRKPDEGDTP